MKVGSKDARPGLASFALLFVKNYAILDLSDKISAGGWWIPKCCCFTALKSDNDHLIYIHVHMYTCSLNQKYSNLLGLKPLDITTIANFVLSTRVSSGIKQAASWYNFVISWFCDTWGSGSSSSTVRVNINKKMKNHQ